MLLYEQMIHFTEKKDEFYHKDLSPLKKLPIYTSSAVVLEYIHNILCFGIMKILLIFWIKGKNQ